MLISHQQSLMTAMMALRTVAFVAFWFTTARGGAPLDEDSFSLAHASDPSLPDFLKYVTRFKKHYAAGEWDDRFAAFKESLRLIHLHNDANGGFTLGLNAHSDMSLDDFTKALVEGPVPVEDVANGTSLPGAQHDATLLPTSAWQSRRACGAGYMAVSGDIIGWGRVNGKGGGQWVATCDACGRLCDGEAACHSYECSPTRRKCNLNARREPTAGPYLDYQFCQAQTCADGYVAVAGDVIGWGEVNGKGGGQWVQNCEACAHLCNEEAACHSYECSRTAKQCNLNFRRKPTVGPYLDYAFCQHVTPQTCAAGYVAVSGDVPGWGRVNGKGGGQWVASCQACAQLCDGDIACHSYECSPTHQKCNLNTQRRPTASSYLDYAFCAQKALPWSLNWVEKGALPEVSNQGTKCGSCWSFAATATLSAAWQIATGNLVTLSRQQLVECTSYLGNHGCSGGRAERTYKYARGSALCHEWSYPYTGVDTGTCHSSCSVAIPEGAVSGYVAVTSNNAMAMLTAVVKQPLSVSIEVSKDHRFQHYQRGILLSNCGTRTNHEVVLVGYGVEYGQRYWFLRNSWGLSWGEEGYFKLRRDVASSAGECGILTDAFYPLVDGSMRTLANHAGLASLDVVAEMSDVDEVTSIENETKVEIDVDIMHQLEAKADREVIAEGLFESQGGRKLTAHIVRSPVFV